MSLRWFLSRTFSSGRLDLGYVRLHTEDVKTANIPQKRSRAGILNALDQL